MHQLHLLFAKPSSLFKSWDHLINFSQTLSPCMHRAQFLVHSRSWQKLGFCHLLKSFHWHLSFPSHSPPLQLPHFSRLVTAFPGFFLSKNCSLYLGLESKPNFPASSGEGPGHSCSSVLLISPVSQHSSPDSSAWFSSGRAMPQQGNSALLCYPQTSRVLSWSLC